jgi:hypothetical protein
MTEGTERTYDILTMGPTCILTTWAPPSWTLGVLAHTLVGARRISALGRAGWAFALCYLRVLVKIRSEAFS